MAAALVVAVCLPWFELPLFGWKVPTPAWNRAGLACFVAACGLALRGVAGAGARWLVRALLPVAGYYWWTSLSLTRDWAAQSLGPIQLKLSPVNQALSKLGAEPVSVYEPSAWKALVPGPGWYASGAILLLSLLLTLLDGPWKRKCGTCQALVVEGDGFCHQCGEALSGTAKCGNCANRMKPDDKFCRACGQKV